MRCLTLDEARRTLATYLGDDGKPLRGPIGASCARFFFGSESFANVYWLALTLENSVGPWEDAWLWLDTPDTWKRQGLHLYNRLRQSYGDLRMIQEAPIHQFHGYERADLCSFITVALLNQWATYLITSHDYGRMFISQSSGGEVWGEEETLRDLEAELQTHGISVQIESSSPP